MVYVPKVEPIPDLLLDEHEVQLRDILQEYAGLEDDEHGKDTPARYLKALDEMTACKNDSDAHMESCIKWKTFDSPSDEMVTQTGITFTSLCNHHLVPFIGVAHIAYVPNGRIVGLSKLARVTRHFAKQLQVQEELTADIANFIQACLKPTGLAVVLEAEHMCMTIRGVQAPGSKTTTSKMLGVFADHTRTAKAEFQAILARL